MLRRLSVRGKILATLAVPIIVLIAATALIAVQAVTAALDGRQYELLARTTPVHDELMAAIQNEFTTTLRVVDGEEVPEDEFAQARATTDSLRSEYLSETDEINFSRFPLAARRAWNDARNGLVNLDRGIIDEFLENRTEINAMPAVVTAFNSAISSQEDYYQTITDSVPDREVARYLALYASTFDLRAAYSNELRAATAVIDARATITADDATASNAAIAIQNVIALEAATNAALQNLGITDFALPEMASDQVSARDSIRAGRPGSITTQEADIWRSATADYDRQLSEFQVKVHDSLISQVSAMANAARTQAFATAAIGLIAVIISLIIALLIARRIVLPLSRLTSAAKDVRDKLPTLVEQVAVPGTTPDLIIEPIPVESSDEIGQLATAFNDVNETTVEVAQEQAALRGSIAEMFVNVARRDHALLNRQLSFLDELERSEEDPTVLSNLFRLDHLATRMRRNSESLLVLAGIDSGRRVRQAMALSDVVRTASSEIEAYDRISLTLLHDPEMLGHYALYAAHLLAEVLENATMFSDPSQQVEVTTNADAAYVSVAIRDFGLGMSQEELAEARKKVESRSASDAVGAQRLGLFVVGRLAEKLDATVSFDEAPNGGTLVVVAFPRSLFAAEDATHLEDQETATSVAPVQRSAKDITDPDAWVPPVPVAEVDLEALTDGTTATGMPRRRTGPDDGGSADLDENQIVLPALATPDEVSIPFSTNEDASQWQPLQSVDVTGAGGLPSRGAGSLPVRAATGPVPTIPEESDEPAVPLDTERRSSMFSRFRSAGELAPTDDQPEETAASEQPTDEPEDAVQGRASMFSSFRPTGHDEAAAPVADLGEDTWAPAAGFGAVASDDETSVAASDQYDGPDLTEQWTPPEITGVFTEPVAQEEWTPPATAPVAESPAGQWLAGGAEDDVPAASTVDYAAEAPHDIEDDFAPAADDEGHHSRIVLPRHARQADLERMIREYGSPEAVSAAITGPVPVVAEPGSGEGEATESYVAESPDLDGEGTFEPVAEATEWGESSAAGDLDGSDVASGYEVVETEYVETQPIDEFVPEQPVEVATEDATDVWAPQEQLAVPQLAPDEEDGDLPSDDTFVVVRPGRVGATVEPEIAEDTDASQPTDQQVAEQYVAPFDEPVPATNATEFVGEAPAWSPAIPEQPVAAPPSFGDVLAEPSEPTAAPEKKSRFGRLFKRKKSEPANTPTRAGAHPEPPFPGPAQVPSQAPQPTPDFGGDVGSGGFAAGAPLVPSAPYAEPVSFSAPEPAVAEQPAYAPAGGFGGFAPAQEPAAQYTPAVQVAQPQHEPQGWSPDAIDFSSPDTPRSMSPELAAMLASRADLQDQALAELSQLSTYRPQQVTPDDSGGLVKRKKADPVSESMDDDPTKQRITRDASVLRSRLSAFQSGTSRGREAATKPIENSNPSAEGDSHDAS